MIYYLAHPWSNNPNQSFKNAAAWTMQLRTMGYYVFSPILHTHPYWKLLKKVCDETAEYAKNEDWLDWDIKMIEGLMDKPSWGIVQKYNQGVTILMSNTAWGLVSTFDEDPMLWFSKGCEKEYKFAKENDIRVLRLEEFLEGKEIEI